MRLVGTRSLRWAATVAVLALGLLIVTLAPAAQAQNAEPTTPPVEIDEVNDVDSPLGEIIPKPNSGAPPENPGDRGGALQLTLLALVVTFFAFAVFSVRRQVRAAQANRTSTQPEASANPDR